MSPKKISVGLVGCGVVAHRHAQALKKIRQAEIKAVADIDERRARQFATEYNVASYYNSLSAMLENEDIMAVSILTNPQSHAELVIEAMNAGKHVLVEKPMCVTLKEAEDMVSASERNGVILFPVEQVVFTPAVQRALKIIASGKTGAILSIYTYMSVVTLINQMTKNILPKWIYSLPGKIYGELIPHALYTTLALLGERVEKTYVSYLEEERENLKVACPFKELRISLETKNRYATIVMTARNISRHEVQMLVIDCEREKIVIDLPVSTILIRDYSLPRLSQFLQYPRSFFDIFFKNLSDLIALKMYSGVSWEVANEQFVKSIVTNTPPPITGKDGLEWVRVTELIWRECLYNNP
ncbi:Gfo/Idh/MocA family oxidoreductase [Candidatus Bathyarchaeota archaeon]|nr:Gfo/Idh/MocA family oxidoreductase [Candidatus Bathyarchaeota archaeon]